VIIKDHVDLGSLCTIDKGVTSSTIIGEGTKIDNQVHIGHDTVIGKRCLIASQVGIAGCVVMEDFVTVWGQVGITSGVTIGEKAVISAQSGVSKSLEGHKSYFGTPADDFRKKYKELASIRLIPKIVEKLDKL
jgi:UDP-3-O-[3-hydroxymyristoyl] glucosamine N-acyltransferase